MNRALPVCGQQLTRVNEDGITLCRQKQIFAKSVTFIASSPVSRSFSTHDRGDWGRGYDFHTMNTTQVVLCMQAHCMLCKYVYLRKSLWV